MRPCAVVSLLGVSRKTTVIQVEQNCQTVLGTSLPNSRNYRQNGVDLTNYARFLIYIEFSLDLHKLRPSNFIRLEMVTE